MTARLTTREAAEVLGCLPVEALAILKTAGTRHQRMGHRGLILWNADDVRRLKASLSAANADPGRDDS